MEVDAGGHRLHLRVVGKSGPVVVLESGLPGGIKGWQQVQEQAGRFSRVVAYERAGSGKSEMGPLPRDGDAIVADLHEALHSGGLSPPYVLVGHSMGGPYVRVFAGMYPGEVGGMVLVDPTRAESYESMEELKGWFAAHCPEEWARVEAQCAKAPAELESLNWMLASSAKEMEMYVATLPQTRAERMRRAWWAKVEDAPAISLPANASAGARGEFAAVTESFREAMAARPLPTVPIVLLSAQPDEGVAQLAEDLDPAMRELRREGQRRKLAEHRQWVEGTPGAKLVIAKGSSHDIPSDDPEIVVEAVRGVVGAMGREWRKEKGAGILRCPPLVGVDGRWGGFKLRRLRPGCLESWRPIRGLPRCRRQSGRRRWGRLRVRRAGPESRSRVPRRVRRCGRRSCRGRA